MWFCVLIIYLYTYTNVTKFSLCTQHFFAVALEASRQNQLIIVRFSLLSLKPEPAASRGVS